MAPPGPETVSEPTSSLKPVECPPWLLPLDAHMAGWCHGPLPRVPVPTTLPTWPLALRAPLHAGPLRYPCPSWALGLPRPTSPVPGVPTKRYSPFNSHAPSPSTVLLHPSKWISSLHSHQQQNDLHFVNLANPLTNITLTPGPLGGNHSSPQSLIAACMPHSLHLHRPAGPHSLIKYIFHSSTHIIAHITEHCHSTH